MAFARRVVLALLVAGCQSWKLPPVNQGRRAQFYTQQSDGAYKYGFDSAEGLFQVQEGGPTNEVRGEFGADGGKTEYTAGVGGFVVTSHKKPTSRGVPTRAYQAAHKNAAPVRFATLEELTTPPKPVADTPEVAAAKRQFQAAYNAAAAAAEAAPDTNIITASAKQPSGLYIAPAVTRGNTRRLVQPAVTRVQTRRPVQPAVTYGQSSRPVEIAHVRSSQGEDGSYQFSYETSDSSRHESADSANNVQGNFEFVADDCPAPARGL
ncbi:uncharacterized protein LOC119100810 [Pollicipes pollicipes]|uniref:uncharacterized protein LOC119100810 n=1 Tax=Pollicipes pollicipes TaxID=41117 RepID=UPI001884E452|nr:uncharacterized protein LOC119100810 [Pollicipes pollicipes]